MESTQNGCWILEPFWLLHNHAGSIKPLLDKRKKITGNKQLFVWARKRVAESHKSNPVPESGLNDLGYPLDEGVESEEKDSQGCFSTSHLSAPAFLHPQVGTLGMDLTEPLQKVKELIQVDF